MQTIEPILLARRQTADMPLSQALPLLEVIARQNGLKLSTGAGWLRAVKILNLSINQN
jgi:hypothetical protein